MTGNDCYAGFLFLVQKSIQHTNMYLSTKMIDNQKTENYNKENELLIYLLIIIYLLKGVFK